tara:strand:- start:630 stop:974 length:345 start_codon:yes stop_codon:yes gene_type:complete
MARNGTGAIYENDNELYEEFIEDRGLTSIRQYRTPRYPVLTPQFRRQTLTIEHTWKQGDKFYKLAYEYYNDPTLWWIIAWYNQAPNEGILKLGRTVYVPSDPNRMIKFFRYGSV